MPSLLQISSVHHVLEIAGPRGQVWRPAHSTMGGMFREAQALADQGNLAGALHAAQDSYIEANGGMHGVAFRVRSHIETLSGFGSAKDILEEPAGKEKS